VGNYGTHYLTNTVSRDNEEKLLPDLFSRADTAIFKFVGLKFFPEWLKILITRSEQIQSEVLRSFIPTQSACNKNRDSWHSQYCSRKRGTAQQRQNYILWNFVEKHPNNVDNLSHYRKFYWN